MLDFRDHHRKRISAEARRDLLWWQYHAQQSNGVTLIPAAEDCQAVMCHTDACLQGGAGIWNKHWFYMDFKESNKSSIAIKEFTIVLVAIQTWGVQWKGKRIIFYVDNSNVVDTCNARTSKSPHIMKLLRNFLLLAAKFSIPDFLFRHIPSHENFLADRLSRKDFSVVTQNPSLLNSSKTPTSPLQIKDF